MITSAPYRSSAPTSTKFSEPVQVSSDPLSESSSQVLMMRHMQHRLDYDHSRLIATIVQVGRRISSYGPHVQLQDDTENIMETFKESFSKTS